MLASMAECEQSLALSVRKSTKKKRTHQTVSSFFCSLPPCAVTAQTPRKRPKDLFSKNPLFRAIPRDDILKYKSTPCYYDVDFCLIFCALKRARLFLDYRFQFINVIVQAVVHCHVVASTMTVIVSWFCLYFWLNYVNSPKSIAFYKYIYYLCNREKTTKE